VAALIHENARIRQQVFLSREHLTTEAVLSTTWPFLNRPVNQ
jgi:hypothetical protein